MSNKKRKHHAADTRNPATTSTCNGSSARIVKENTVLSTRPRKKKTANRSGRREALSAISKSKPASKYALLPAFALTSNAPLNQLEESLLATTNHPQFADEVFALADARRAGFRKLDVRKTAPISRTTRGIHEPSTRQLHDGSKITRNTLPVDGRTQTQGKRTRKSKVCSVDAPASKTKRSDTDVQKSDDDLLAPQRDEARDTGDRPRLLGRNQAQDLRADAAHDRTTQTSENQAGSYISTRSPQTRTRQDSVRSPNRRQDFESPASAIGLSSATTHEDDILVKNESDECFFVDLDGDCALENCKRLFSSDSLPGYKYILGSPYYDQHVLPRHLVSGLELCDEQESLVRLVLEGHNVFYTGSAGSGKSHVLRAFYAELMHEGKRVSKVGPTGMSAINIGGRTIYNFAGWLPRSKKFSISTLEKQARTGERWERLNTIDVLIIDEISMVDSHQSSRLDRICRAARQPQPPIMENGKRDYGAILEWCDSDEYGRKDDRSPHDRNLPFGGIQVIVTGDFCQLPPVKPFTTCFPCGKETSADDKKNGPWECKSCKETFYPDDCWAFKSPAWKDCRFKAIQLQKAHRQADPEFVEILETFRASEDLSEKQLQILLRNRNKLENAVELFPENRDADRMNSSKLERIEHPMRSYKSVDYFKHNELHTDHKYLGTRGSGLKINSLDDHRYPAMLDIKVGMPVMLLLSGPLETRLVNGSQGVVVGFERYDRTRPYRCRATVPPRISPEFDEYADYREASTKRWFQRSGAEMLPLVKFADGQTQLIYPSCEIEEFGDTQPYTLLSRTQLPIKACWALTIHKSQGSSLDAVVVNLDRAKSRAMVYVALSRATSLQGLRIESKDALAALKPDGRIGPGNKAVRAFYEECFGKASLLRNGSTS